MLQGVRWFARRAIRPDLDDLRGRIQQLERDLLLDRSHADLGPGVAAAFDADRNTPEYQGAFLEPEPLVTVIVATRNRADLLMSRAVASLQEQSYERLEVIVVGDRSTDDSRQRVANLRDPRFVWCDLPGRDPYPNDALWRWMVAGGPAMNEGLRRAGGTFITHLDDDDEHHPQRIEKLLTFTQQVRADLVYHPFSFESADGAWGVNDARELALGRVTTSSIFYHHWLKRVEWDPYSYSRGEPGDWSRLRKFKWLNCNAQRFPEVLLTHYRERGNTRDV